MIKQISASAIAIAVALALVITYIAGFISGTKQTIKAIKQILKDDEQKGSGEETPRS